MGGLFGSAAQAKGDAYGRILSGLNSFGVPSGQPGATPAAQPAPAQMSGGLSGSVPTNPGAAQLTATSPYGDLANRLSLIASQRQAMSERSGNWVSAQAFASQATQWRDYASMNIQGNGFGQAPQIINTPQELSWLNSGGNQAAPPGFFHPSGTIVGDSGGDNLGGGGAGTPAENPTQPLGPPKPNFQPYGQGYGGTNWEELGVGKGVDQTGISLKPGAHSGDAIARLGGPGVGTAPGAGAPSEWAPDGVDGYSGGRPYKLVKQTSNYTPEAGGVLDQLNRMDNQLKDWNNPNNSAVKPGAIFRSREDLLGGL